MAFPRILLSGGKVFALPSPQVKKHGRKDSDQKDAILMEYRYMAKSIVKRYSEILRPSRGVKWTRPTDISNHPGSSVEYIGLLKYI